MLAVMRGSAPVPRTPRPRRFSASSLSWMVGAAPSMTAMPTSLPRMRLPTMRPRPPSTKTPVPPFSSMVQSSTRLAGAAPRSRTPLTALRAMVQPSTTSVARSAPTMPWSRLSTTWQSRTVSDAWAPPTMIGQRCPEMRQAMSSARASSVTQTAFWAPFVMTQPCSRASADGPPTQTLAPRCDESWQPSTMTLVSWMATAEWSAPSLPGPRRADGQAPDVRAGGGDAQRLPADRLQDDILDGSLPLDANGSVHHDRHPVRPGSNDDRVPVLGHGDGRVDLRVGRGVRGVHEEFPGLGGHSEAAAAGEASRAAGPKERSATGTDGSSVLGDSSAPSGRLSLLASLVIRVAAHGRGHEPGQPLAQRSGRARRPRPGRCG